MAREEAVAWRRGAAWTVAAWKPKGVLERTGRPTSTQYGCRREGAAALWPARPADPVSPLATQAPSPRSCATPRAGCRRRRCGPASGEPRSAPPDHRPLGRRRSTRRRSCASWMAPAGPPMRAGLRRQQGRKSRSPSRSHEMRRRDEVICACTFLWLRFTVCSSAFVRITNAELNTVQISPFFVVCFSLRTPATRTCN